MGGEVSGSPTLWVFFASPGLSLSLTLLYYALHISLQNTSFPGVLARLLLLVFSHWARTVITGPRLGELDLRSFTCVYVFLVLLGVVFDT